MVSRMTPSPPLLSKLHVPVSSGFLSIGVAWRGTSLWGVYILLCFVWMSTGVWAKKLAPLHWNSTNPMFAPGRPVLEYRVVIRDTLDIVCPQAALAGPGLAGVEYSNIYMVGEWGYLNCQLTPDKRFVGSCHTPAESSVLTVVFREFTPMPSGIEVSPGHSYYFITTSTGNMTGIKNQEGGLCLSRNMKVKFNVVKDDRVEPPAPVLVPVPENIPSASGESKSPSRIPLQPIWGVNAEIPGQLASKHDSNYYETGEIDNNSGKTSSNKADWRSDKPTETVKAEVTYQIFKPGGQLASTATKLDPNPDHATYVINEEYYPKGDSSATKCASSLRLRLSGGRWSPASVHPQVLTNAVLFTVVCCFAVAQRFGLVYRTGQLLMADN